MKSSFLLLALMLPSFTLQARLLETEEQIEARYGKPKRLIDIGNPVVTVKEYITADMEIDIYYINGKSQSEYYNKKSGAKFALPEIQILLDANSLGSTWIKKDEGESIEWNLKSGAGRATYAPSVEANSLTIATAEYSQMQDAAVDIAVKEIAHPELKAQLEKEKKAKNLQGF